MTRREFLRNMMCGVAAILVPGLLQSEQPKTSPKKEKKSKISPKKEKKLTPAARRELAAAMVEPIKASLVYQALKRI